MVKCESCGKEYHWCCSCECYDWFDNSRFCCEKCAKNSDSYLRLLGNIKELLSNIDEKDRVIFANILNDIIEDGWLEEVYDDLNGREGIEAWGSW